MVKQLSMDAVRRSNRYRVTMNLPVRLGFKTGTLVDISTAGVLVTHAGVQKTGSIVEITFDWANQRFSATAKVVSCTVVGLGGGENTLYASRLYFTNLPDPSRQLLDTLLAEPSMPQEG